MITPTDCVRVMIPELTRPTQMTTVPADDWMTPVIRVPKMTPLMVEEVSFCNTPCILPPASFSRPAPMIDMPYRNSAIPPNREVMCVISISILLKMFFLFFLNRQRTAAGLFLPERRPFYYSIERPVSTSLILHVFCVFDTFLRGSPGFATVLFADFTWILQTIQFAAADAISRRRAGFAAGCSARVLS